MKPLSLADAKKALLLRDEFGTVDRRLFREALQRLPPELDLGLVVEPVVRHLRGAHRWMFAHDCKRLPARGIRAVLGSLTQLERDEALFLRSAVDPSLSDAAVEREWQQALSALHELSTQYPWTSRQLRTALSSLAANSRIVGALQATVVGARSETELSMLAVLAIEGSEASVDALIPQFAAVQNLERLESLLVHAKNPGIQALVESVRQRLAERHGDSAAVEAFSRSFGLSPTVKTLRLDLAIYGKRRGARFATHLLEWHVNSREQNWWSVTLHRFSDQSELKSGALGPSESGCEFEQLPVWIAQQTRRARIKWMPDYLECAGSLRGKIKTDVVRWLLGATVIPAVNNP